jgi:sulfatase modifying factor 1
MEMMKRRWGASAAALSTMAVGCAMMVGIDKDYHPRSCIDLLATCGPMGDESCCAITKVPGGMYDRGNDAQAPEPDPAPATVSDFRLDRFEITVGRFRKFVAAYPGSKPKTGAGAHPLIATSGWNAAWDMKLPADQAALRAELVNCDPQTSPQCFPTWTDKPEMNENLPMNTITWYEAFAFCAWDGGRLPTEAEWIYATAGGSEQRTYPWGSTAPDGVHSAYGCTEDGSGSQDCASTDILPVGSKPAGDGRFGQADLAGSLFEWNLDWYKSPYLTPCVNCACISCECTGCSSPGSVQVLRGGSWASTALLLSSSNIKDKFDSNRLAGSPALRLDYVGARCVRSP